MFSGVASGGVASGATERAHLGSWRECGLGRHLGSWRGCGLGRHLLGSWRECGLVLGSQAQGVVERGGSRGVYRIMA